MIIVFAGFNGSGKTISMVREMLPYDVVFANFAFAGRKDQELHISSEVDELFARLLSYIKRMGGVRAIRKMKKKVAFCVDEAGVDFSSRQFKAITRNTAYLFAQHRKLGIDFLMTAQNVQMLDRMLRLNVAITAYCGHFFMLGFQRWHSGISDKKESKLYQVVYWLPAYYKYYDTYEMVESTQFLMEGEIAELEAGIPPGKVSGTK